MNKFTNNDFLQTLGDDDYLVVPTTILISMPWEWRKKLIDTLKQIPSHIDVECIKFGPYSVGMRGAKGKFVFDYVAKSGFLLPTKKKLPWYKRLFK